MARRRARRRAGVPARRARDPRGRRAPAQAPGAARTAAVRRRRSCRCSRACRRPSRTACSSRHGARASCSPPTSPRPRSRCRASATWSTPAWRASSATATATRSSCCRSRPISQAAANQRAGRCGRVADGVCIRLYDEEDFAARPRFTDPEILRSSLAGVILRMKALRLGDGRGFPVPRPAAAQGDRRRLRAARRAERGRRRQRAHADRPGAGALPLDPRVGRMILAARERQCAAPRCWSSPSALCVPGRARPAARAGSRRPTRSTRSSPTRGRSSSATSSCGSGSKQGRGHATAMRLPAHRRRIS